MSKNILVLGAGGYIGSVLTDLLLIKKYKVHAYDRFFFGIETLKKNIANKNLVIIKKDIRDIETKDFDKIDHVIDLAALSNDPSCELDTKLTRDINFHGRMKAARLASKNKVKKYIFSSTCSVYGDTKDNVVDETSKLAPISEYAKSSVDCEKVLLNEFNNKDFCTTIIRNGTVFGVSPRMRFDLVVNLMTLTAFEKAKIYILGGGDQYRPLIHVKDVCDCIYKILKSKNNLVKNEIFNLGIENKKISEIAFMIQNTLNKEIIIEKIEDDNDKRNYNVSFEKIKKKIKFFPKYSINFGIQEVYQSLKTKKITKNQKTSTVEWYKFLINSKKIIDEVAINNKIF
jgi:nucleoside-diphosphate-sugar epimerase